MKTTYLTHAKPLLMLLAYAFFIHLTANAQPIERPKNRYKEPNGSYGAPYTMFEISEFAINKITGTNKRINELIEQIKHPDKDSNYYKLYEHYSTQPNPTESVKQEDKIYDPLAAHAKNKAFIALVGVDGSGNPLPVSEINRLKDEAYSALENMNTDVLNLIRLHSFGLDAGQLLLYRTRELVQYLQAYDMLKAGGRIANYAEDKSDLEKGVYYYYLSINGVNTPAKLMLVK
ncbi:MAG: hypothetical protein ACK5UI_00250 [Bacteroidota bacterium]